MIKNLIYTGITKKSKELFLSLIKPRIFRRLQNWGSSVTTWLIVKKYLVKRILFYLKKNLINPVYRSWKNIFLAMLILRPPLGIKNSINTWATKLPKHLFKWLTQPEFIQELRTWRDIFLAGLLVIKKLITRAFFDFTKTSNSSFTARVSNKKLHWLMMPKTIHKLWISGSVFLTGLLLIGILERPKGYFGVDSTFGFNAWYGFIVCIGMVAAAKGLGVFLKREDTYYERD